MTVDLCLSAAPPPDDPLTTDVNESTTAPIVCRANAQAAPLTYTVQKKTLLSIDVTPGPGQQNLAALKTLQFRATGTYSDGSQQDLTRHVNWTSSQPLKAPIVNGVIAGLAGVALITTVFAAVFHAEVVAHRIGEPFGTWQ